MGIEEDATTIRFNTLQSKYARDVEALNFRNQASAARASAKNARTAGWIGGLTSVLSTGGQVAGMSAGYPTGARVRGGSITLGAQASRPDWYRNRQMGRGGYAF